MRNTNLYSPRNKTILVEAAAALFIFLFVYTAISKIDGHDLFAVTLRESPPLKEFSEPVAWLVPAMELLLATLLFIPKTRLYGLLFTGLFMLLLTLYVAAMIMGVEKLPCSCGGIISKLSWKEHLVLNASLTAIAFAGWKLEKQNKHIVATSRDTRKPV